MAVGGGGRNKKSDVSGPTSLASAPSTDFSNFPFSANEKVLCFHGPLMYEANVLDAKVVNDEQTSERSNNFLVHYKGWSKKWDEWVPETRVLKHNEANLIRQQQLLDSVKPTKSGGHNSQRGENANKNDNKENASAPGNGNTGSQSAAEKHRKRVRETVDKEEEFLRKQEVKMPIPDNLKVQLVDDWQFVTKDKCLVTLPRSVTVTEILRDWLAQRIAQRQGDEGGTVSARYSDEAKETHDGLRMYFNAALGSTLLYRIEREQYRDIIKQNPNTELADIYGAEHLLRLFVSLPALIAHTSMDQRAMDTLRGHVVDCCKFMVKNARRFFQVSYEPAPPEYLINIRE